MNLAELASQIYNLTRFKPQHTLLKRKANKFLASLDDLRDEFNDCGYAHPCIDVLASLVRAYQGNISSLGINGYDPKMRKAILHNTKEIERYILRQMAKCCDVVSQYNQREPMRRKTF